MIGFILSSIFWGNNAKIYLGGSTMKEFWNSLWYHCIYPHQGGTYEVAKRCHTGQAVDCEECSSIDAATTDHISKRGLWVFGGLITTAVVAV